LVMIAVFSVNRSGIIEMIPWPKEEIRVDVSNEVVIQSSDFRFITK